VSNLIYIHGFGSETTPESTKIKSMLHDGHRVSYVNYNSHGNFQEVFSRLTHIIERSSIEDDTKFIGTSLGGFYASHLGERFDMSTILLNPVIDPHDQMEQFLFPVNGRLPLSSESLNSYKGIKTIDHKRNIVIASRHDEILDVSVTTNHIKKSTLILVDNVPHRFSSPYFEEHVSPIL
jgi:predicted esterase YcpF (UPF0227 family)